MASIIQSIVSRIPGAREDYGSDTLSPLGMVIFLAVYAVIFLTVGVYLWDHAAVPLIPALAKSGKNGKLKILGLGVLSALYIH